MTLGFTEHFGHHFKPVWANDFNKYCVDTYNANFGKHCLSGDIVDILQDPAVIIPPADVVIGGPPCQGFSLLNKKRENDPRNQLWRPFLRLWSSRVPQLYSLSKMSRSSLVPLSMERLSGLLKNWGSPSGTGPRAADYGVPQTRWRAVIVGSKISDPSFVFPPRRTHFNPNGNGFQPGLNFAGNKDLLPGPRRWRTVRDAIGDLPPPVGTSPRDVPLPLDLHFGRTPTPMSLKRYKAIPKEGMNRFDLQNRVPELTPACWIRKKAGGTDLFGRLWWNRPAFTIRTEFFKPEKGRYLHPEQHRPITHREAARLQSFPDSFVFKGTKIEIAKQIGNAVPPLLAARIADIVHVLLTAGKKRKHGRL